MGAPHGTRSKYVNDECRCDECRRANTEYIKRWLGSGSDLTPAKRVHSRITTLRSQGQTYETIAEGTGVPPGTVEAHGKGLYKRVHHETAYAILSWKPDGRAGGLNMDASSFREMLAWLRDFGMSVAAIARASGVSRRTMHRTDHKWVQRQTYDKLRVLYLNARKRATRSGHPCPHCGALLVSHTVDEPCPERKEKRDVVRSSRTT